MKIGAKIKKKQQSSWKLTPFMKFKKMKWMVPKFKWEDDQEIEQKNAKKYVKIDSIKTLIA